MQAGTSLDKWNNDWYVMHSVVHVGSYVNNTHILLYLSHLMFCLSPGSLNFSHSSSSHESFLSSLPHRQRIMLYCVLANYCYMLFSHGPPYPEVYLIFDLDISDMSRFMRKPDFCLCENKGADQLSSYCEADQRLCFR